MGSLLLLRRVRRRLTGVLRRNRPPETGKTDRTRAKAVQPQPKRPPGPPGAGG